MSRRVKQMLLTALVLALVAGVPQMALAKTAYTASKPALSAMPQAGTQFTVSGVIKPKSSATKARAVVKIRLLMLMDGRYSEMDTYRATLHKNAVGKAGTKYTCEITIPMDGKHAVRALQYRHGKLVAKSKITYFSVEMAAAQQIAVDADSHADVTAEAGKPIDVIFHYAGGSMMCASKIHFLSEGFTKTSSDPLKYHSDGLPAGTYAWQCSMMDCHYGNLMVK